MMKIEAVATVYYTCTLSDEEEEKVVNYIKNNPEEFEFMDDKKAIAEAVAILCEDDEIDLYETSTESDFCTNDIRWSEFEHRTPEEILNA